MTDLIRKRYNVLMKVEWKDFIKKAYVVKGDMFRLDKGEAPGLVAKARKIPVGDLLAANPGVEANRYIAGKWYHLPHVIHCITVCEYIW